MRICVSTRAILGPFLRTLRRGYWNRPNYLFSGARDTLWLRRSRADARRLDQGLKLCK